MATSTKKKTGKPSDFQGLRLQFLEEFYPTYADASSRGKTRDIWEAMFARYWGTFPWRLPLKQDPDPTDLIDYAEKPQNPEEEDDKAKLITTTETKIKLWLGRQGRKEGMKDNVWGTWLTRFRTPATAAPKRLADYQFYMQHQDFKSKVTDAFEERKGTLPAKQHMKLRAEIARELLAAEPQEVRERIKEEAEEEHKAQSDKHEDALEGLPALDEEGLDAARKRFSALVTPLLEGLAAHTGYEISLLAGRVKYDKGKPDVDLHARVTDASPANLDFSRANSSEYADVMRIFSKFVWNAHEYRGKPPVTAGSDDSSPLPPTPLSAPTAPSLPPSAPTAEGITTPPTDGTASAVLSAPTQLPTTMTLTTAATPVPAITATGAGEQFSDADIHAYLGLGGAQPEIDLSEEFNFPDHLMPGPAANAFVLGAPPPPPPVDPYGTGFAVPLCSDLRLRLEELAPTERASRVEELRTMDAEGLTRQNNSARNYYMLNGLGLGDAAKETLWGGSEVPAKRKAAKEGRKKGGKKARKTKDPVEEVSDEDEGSESEDEADQTPAPGPEKTKAKKAPAKPKKAPAGRGGGASAASKAWADTAQLLLAKDDFGAEWASLLGVWWKREERAGFEGTRAAHPAGKRPKEVGDWVSRARKYTPAIANADTFGKGWWVWWLDINPDWRGDTRPLSRGTGSWDCLDLYGQNGFLNVLVTLKWWRDAMSVPSPDWEEAVNDVTWVLDEMEKHSASEAASTPATPAPSPAGGSSATRVPAASQNGQEMAEAVDQRQGAPKDVQDLFPTPIPHPSPSTTIPQNPGTRPNPECTPGTVNGTAGRVSGAGAEGLSQEELDEMDDDPEADMDEEE